METDNQLEKSPEVNNHSIVTTNSGDRESLLNKTTPATSPIVSKTAPSSMAAASSDKLFNRELEEYSTKMLELFKTRAAEVEVNEKTTAQLNGIEEEFSWNKIVELSELIFNEYSNDMENITKELDIVNKKVLIWQESAYIFDSEKVTRRLGTQEQWIHSKEEYLKYTKGELMRSAELIDNAIKNLKRSTNHIEQKQVQKS